jgi:hypothetical protein
MNEKDYKQIAEKWQTATVAHGGKFGWTGIKDVKIGNGLDDTTVIASEAEYPRSIYVYEENGNVKNVMIVTLGESLIPYEDNPSFVGRAIRVGYPPGSNILTVMGQTGLAAANNTGGATLMEQKIVAAQYPPTSNITDFRIAADDGSEDFPNSTSIFVNPGWYYKASSDDYKWFGGDTVDVDAELSELGAGEHQLALICFDTENAELEIVTNTAVTGSEKDDYDSTTIDGLSIPHDYTQAGAVHWYEQATISEDDLYRGKDDPRFVFYPRHSHARIFAQTASVTVADTASETTLTGAGQGSLTLPANFFTVGRTIRLKAMGVFSDTGTPTLNVRFKLGSTTICSTGAVALAGTISNNVWSVEIELTCRTVGASGTVIAQGLFKYDESTHAGTTEGMASTTTTTIDTTASQAVNVTVQWGSASPSNTMTCTNLTVERIG